MDTLGGWEALCQAHLEASVEMVEEVFEGGAGVLEVVCGPDCCEGGVGRGYEVCSENCESAGTRM